MRFIFQVLTTVALVARGAAALKDGLQLSETFGGPHGEEYSDVDAVWPDQTVNSITIRSGERVNGVGLDITDSTGKIINLYHGGGGGDQKTLTIGDGEYITRIEAHSGEKDGHTRIVYIQFTTSEGNTITGGNPSKGYGEDTAPDGYQLGGFFGTCGKELDSVGAIWTKIPVQYEGSLEV